MGGGHEDGGMTTGTGRDRRDLDKSGVYRRIAPWYDILDYLSEVSRYRAIRPGMFAGLSGRILDAGVGTGRNIDYYPAGADVTGIDLSPEMLVRAKKRKKSAGSGVVLLQMDATATTFDDNTFDAIVSTFMFCVLDDTAQPVALAELARVLKPGGELRLLEYAVSQRPMRAWVMQHIWAPIAYTLYGARFDRETEQYIDGAGLELVEMTFVYQDILKLLRLRKPQ